MQIFYSNPIRLHFSCLSRFLTQYSTFPHKLDRSESFQIVHNLPQNKSEVNATQVFLVLLLAVPVQGAQGLQLKIREICNGTHWGMFWILYIILLAVGWMDMDAVYCKARSLPVTGKTNNSLRYLARSGTLILHQLVSSCLLLSYFSSPFSCQTPFPCGGSRKTFSPFFSFLSSPSSPISPNCSSLPLMHYYASTSRQISWSAPMIHTDSRWIWEFDAFPVDTVFLSTDFFRLYINPAHSLTTCAMIITISSPAATGASVGS